MKGMIRVALMTAFMAVAAGSLRAAEVEGPGDKTDVYVVNNHVTDVRVYLEDADGRLHNFGRIGRGELKNIDVPADIAAREFRIKVFPTAPVWSPISEDIGIKTNPLDSQRDHQVTVWVEPDITQSVVEIARG